MLRLKSSPGFTIVELIIIIAIVGILAIIVGTSYLNFTRQSHVSAVKAELLQAAKSMETFNLRYRYYPPSLYPLTDYKASDTVAIEVTSSDYPEYGPLS